jgi:heme b synthase
MPHPSANHPGQGDADGARQTAPPRLIAWELTRACVLNCRHCRAAATPHAGAEEFSTEEVFRVLANVADFAKPLMILTGGEPLLREDIFEIIARARDLDLPVALATCGTTLDPTKARRLLEAGVKIISVSIDGATADSHDDFRGVPGAFAGTMRGIEAARAAGLKFQVNTTITKHNLAELPAILQLAKDLGAVMFNPFLLVPTGRGKAMASEEISPAQYEQTLRWLAERQDNAAIPIRVTCAPHYQRILRQMGLRQNGPPSGGCLGGKSFAFISHAGKVQICGFLDIEAGDLRAANHDFRHIWETSSLFRDVRDVEGYHGKCGVCEYNRVCGGCRARAHALTGDLLAPEPFCTHRPGQPSDEPVEQADEADVTLDERKVLSVIQTDFPAELRPYAVLGEQLGMCESHVYDCVRAMRQRGVIRRLGAVFNSRRLGYVSTLAAARVPEDTLESVAAVISEQPGVTHNYQRDGAYNLWFTLTARSQTDLDELHAWLQQRTGVTIHRLPALERYKIRVTFDVLDAPPAERVYHETEHTDEPIELTEADRDLVRALQENLPESQTPFDDIAAMLHRDAEDVLTTIRDWIARGVIRRFGAVVRHHRLGFLANGMAVFVVPDDRLAKVGRALARRHDVSHCYHRPALPDFPYTLYAMIHGRQEDDVRAVAAELAETHGVCDYQVLFSRRQFKKASMRYFREQDAES